MNVTRVWNLITWWGGIPSSSSHALIGGLLGAGVTKAGISAIVWSGLLTTGAFIVLSPLFGFFLAMLLVLAVSWIFARSSPRAVEGTFQWLQFASASLISLGHGGNDAQKTMGVIACCCSLKVILAASSTFRSGSSSPARPP